MFKYKSVREQLIEERRKNEALTEMSAHNKADIDYIAMMTDVELEAASENGEVTENE